MLSRQIRQLKPALLAARASLQVAAPLLPTTAAAAMATIMATTSATQPQTPLKGVIFDLDGTLSEPHSIDFMAMRRRLNLPTGPGAPGILDSVMKLPTEAERAAAHAIIVEEENAALARMKLNKGMAAMLETAARLELKLAICTRNNSEAIKRFHEVLAEQGLHDHVPRFMPTLARGDRCPVLGVELSNKPHPDPALSVLRAWGLARAETAPVKDSAPTSDAAGDSSPQRHQHHQHRSSAAGDDAAGSQAPALIYPDFLFVGDYIDDLMCGRQAGMRTCLLSNGEAEQEDSSSFQVLRDHPHLVDYHCSDGFELAALLEKLAESG